MNTNLLLFYLVNPSLLLSQFYAEPLFMTCLVYWLVWLVLKPKHEQVFESSLKWHLAGIGVTLTGAAVIRIFAIATFAGAGALEFESGVGAGMNYAIYMVFLPAVFSFLYINWAKGKARSIRTEEKLRNSLPELVQAAAGADNTKLLSILDRGVDPDSAGPEGQTALMLASRNGHESTVKLLLERGASVAAVTKSGNNAESFAKKFDHQEIVALFELHKSDLSQK